MAETETRCKYNVEVDDEARHNVNTEIQQFDRQFSQEQRVSPRVLRCWDTDPIKPPSD